MKIIKDIKENYINIAFILVFLMLLWPLYINNFELFIFEIFIIIGFFVLVAINIIVSTSSSISGVIIIGIISIIIAGIISIIIAVIITSIIIVDIIIAVIIAVIITDIIISIIVGSISNYNISEKMRVLYFLEIISLLSFAILSFTVIPIKDYTVIEYNNEEVVLKKGEYFFNTNMGVKIINYKTINHKIIEPGNYKITLAVNIKRESRISLEEMEAFKIYEGLDLLNIDFGETDSREKIQKFLDKKFPNLEIIIREITYNNPIVWK